MKFTSTMLLCSCLMTVIACAPKKYNPGDPASAEFLETSILRCLVDPSCPPPPVVSNDFNGDGFSDLLVGAPKTASGLQGYARIIFGSTETIGALQLTISGGADAEGVCVTGLDMNGDKIQDVVVGAPFANGSAGAIYVFLGGGHLATTQLTFADASFVFTGEGLTAGDLLGFYCNRAGDVNGDGYDDLIVSATDLSAAGADRAYIFFGGANPAGKSAANADVILMGGTLQPQQVAGAGDVNGDGFDDVLVSDQNAGTGGVVYLFHGGANFQGNITESGAAVAISAVGAGDTLAIGLGGAGDLNKDGYHDILMGANKASTDFGEAYLFLGGPSLTSGTTASANVTFQAENVTGSNDYLGASTIGVPDLNGDGFREILLGTGKIDNSTSANRAYLFYYTTALSGTVNVSAANAMFTGTVGAGKYSFNTVSPGDMNGDGLVELVMGDHDFNTQQGRVSLFQGRNFSGAFLASEADATFAGDASGDDFAFSLSGGYTP